MSCKFCLHCNYNAMRGIAQQVGWKPGDKTFAPGYCRKCKKQKGFNGVVQEDGRHKYWCRNCGAEETL